MSNFVEPREGEHQKAYLHRAYGIGKGMGRGRISVEGHARLTEARKKGFAFPEDTKVSVPKSVKPTKPTTSKPAPVTLPREADTLDRGAIRSWARSNGHTIGDRGRIKPEIVKAYLDAVPVGERTKRQDGNEVPEPAPRIHPVGTTFRLDFTNRHGQKETRVVNDKTACGNCRWSLGWCACTKPHVTVGYEVGDVRVTAQYPKGT